MSGRILPFPGTTLPPASDPGATALAARPVPVAPAPPRPPRALIPEEEALQDRMFRAYFQGRRRARNHTPSAIRNDEAAVRDLLAFIGQPLWALTEDDFEAWAAHLGVTRRLAVGSQRRMQGAVACFVRYLVRHTAFQNEVRQRFDARLIEIAHEENRIIHTTDANGTRKRRYLCMAEFSDLLQIQDAAIEIALTERRRCTRALMRDKAMFIAFYTYGLRLSEGYGLNMHSFRANPDLPELGGFGVAEVYGKGSNGSGPRFRAVLAVLADIRPILEWYLEVVRPLYHPPADEPAMWLSERGRRLTRSSISSRFKKLLSITGFDPKLLSTHGLRHMSVTHEAEADVPLHFTQLRHGHAHASTTQQYTHLSNQFIRDVARRLVREVSAQGEDHD